MFFFKKEKNKVNTIEFRLNWLLKEVELLEKKIEFFDGLFFKIKNWAIVSWFALLSLAITEKSWAITLMSILIPVLFSIIEASYKRIQIEFIQRTRNIMKLLNDEDELKKRINGNKLDFPIYDLLNIYGENKIQYKNPIENRWESLIISIKKTSVSIVYLFLFSGSVVVSIILYFF